MKPLSQILGNIYEQAANGRDDARLFLLGWHHYCHLIDDLVDGDVTPTAETICEVLVMACKLLSTPFYQANALRLSGVVVAITNTYADSVAWERTDTAWKKQVADTIRQTGNDMIATVADITGGYRGMRSISLALREEAWRNQHPEVSNG